jgi:hypothetical protein
MDCHKGVRKKKGEKERGKRKKREKKGEKRREKKAGILLFKLNYTFFLLTLHPTQKIRPSDSELI